MTQGWGGATKMLRVIFSPTLELNFTLKSHFTKHLKVTKILRICVRSFLNSHPDAVNLGFNE
jgi:hypothetical protein